MSFYVIMTQRIFLWGRDYYRGYLYSYNQNGFGGKYKSSDNIIAETDGNGIQKVRFAPVSAFETEEAMRIMTERFLEEWNSGKTDKLLLIPDMLCHLSMTKQNLI